MIPDFPPLKVTSSPSNKLAEDRIQETFPFFCSHAGFVSTGWL